MLNRPPSQEWYKNPTLLMIGGVGIFAAIILLRSQKAPASTDNTTTTPVGGSYTYLDGSGMQHITATDPQGNLLGYSSLPPNTSSPQTGQLSTYVGSMSGVSLQQPYGGWTPPYYSQQNWLQYNPMNANANN